MKLATMKIVCLLAVVSGVVMIGLVLDVGFVQLVRERVLENWPKQEDGALNLRMPGAVFALALLVVGLYGLLPKLRAARSSTITFRGANGDIVLQLRPIRKVLLKMMRRMPEVYTINLDVRPDSDGRRARIDADVVLKNCAALGARQCAKIVAECLATTARGLLGLEELSAVHINVNGVHVDVAATSKQIREQMALRQEEEAEAYAVSRPPIAAVTMDGVPEDAPAATEETAPATAAPEEAQQPARADEPTAEPVPEAMPEPVEEVIPEPVEMDDVPPLTDNDEPLPPAPQYNQEGEITKDDIAEADHTADAMEVTPDMHVVESMETSPWTYKDVPEPVPEEFSGDITDSDIDAKDEEDSQNS